jgi:hypothetical protein
MPARVHTRILDAPATASGADRKGGPRAIWVAVLVRLATFCSPKIALTGRYLNHETVAAIERLHRILSAPPAREPDVGAR